MLACLPIILLTEMKSLSGSLSMVIGGGKEEGESGGEGEGESGRGGEWERGRGGDWESGGEGERVIGRGDNRKWS